MSDIEDIYELTPMQQGLLFHSVYTPGTDVYIVQFCYLLKGSLAITQLKRAWQQVIARHQALRTSFYWKDTDKPVQIVHQQVELPWEEEDWQGVAISEHQTHLDALLSQERARGLDLLLAPLFRLTLVHLIDDAFYLVWSCHHLVLDGWSGAQVIKEVFELYEAYTQGQEPALPAVRPYSDYIAWQQQQDMSVAETFWRQQLKGFQSPTPLGVDHAPDEEMAEEEGTEELVLPEVTATALRAFARNNQLTLGTILQGTWALLTGLSSAPLHHSQEFDIVIGVVISGRPVTLIGVESIVGLFINTLPLRVRIDPNTPLITWLKGLQEQLIELQSYEYSSLTQIQGWSDVPRGQPLFNTIIALENYAQDARWNEIKGLDIEVVRISENTHYPLGALVTADEEILLSIKYDRRRFDPPVVQRMLGHWQTLLTGLMSASQQGASGSQRASGPPQGRAALQLPLLTEAERRQILQEWNTTGTPYAQDQCIHQLFEALAEQTPDRVALVCGHEQLSYQQLNRSANQLAHYLQQQHVGPEVLVGLCLERSVEMIVALLAILKAGGAYVPLDPSYPPERLQFMLHDTALTLLVTSSKLAHSLDVLASLPFAPILIDQYIEQEHDRRRGVTLRAPVSPAEGRIGHDVLGNGIGHVLGNGRTQGDAPTHMPARMQTNPISDVSSDHLAYVIYTSGSTGQPKGAMLTHKGLCNLACAQQQIYHMPEQSRILQFASLNFDASIFEIIMAWSAGATLHLTSQDTLRSGTELTRLMQQEAITALTIPPSALSALLPEDHFPDLQTLICAGEACPRELTARWARGRRMFNAYGPTETTVWANVERCEAAEAPPIGRPITNTQMYVLDTYLNPVPIGVPGELYIGGVGLSRGYLNRPDLSAERFVPHPFVGAGLASAQPGTFAQPGTSVQAGARLYKTGDVGRYLPSGAIVYMGRNDEQVKVRGYRIELVEITSALSLHPAVQQAVVLVQEETTGAGYKNLIAHVVPKNTEDLEDLDSARAHELIAKLRLHLQEKLPVYMLPTAIVLQKTLPLTANGKVDRKALAAYRHAPATSSANYVAPQTAWEQLCVQIWQEILGVEKVGIYDNFFELGGHSLLIIQFHSKLQQEIKKDVPLVDLFKYPTIYALTTYLEQETSADQETQDRGEMISQGKSRLRKRLDIRQGTRER